MFGLGFRPRYLGDLVDARPAVDWLELVSENFMGIGGRTRQMLLRLRADYPLALHGVSLSIAGTDPLDTGHLTRLRELADEIEPRCVSDHLCWTSWRGRESHDLLPIAYTEAALTHVARRVDQVQERLGRRLYLENPTVYVAFADAAMDEAEFLAALCARSGCGVLLDVNNLFVNALNLGVDPRRYLERLQPESVAYLHVAGHAVLPDVRVDTHDATVSDPVWAVYRAAAARFPAAATVLERDGRFPEFAELLVELGRARAEAGAARAGETPAVPAWEHDAAALCPPARTAGVSPAEWGVQQEKFFAALTTATAVPPLAPTAPVPPRAACASTATPTRPASAKACAPTSRPWRTSSASRVRAVGDRLRRPPSAARLCVQWRRRAAGGIHPDAPLRRRLRRRARRAGRTGRVRAGRARSA